MGGGGVGHVKNLKNHVIFLFWGHHVIIATSTFERNFTEISQLQAQRRNEIRVMNDCI